MRSPVIRRACAAAGLIMAALMVVGCQRADEGETNVLVIGEPPKMADPAAGPLTETQAVLLQNVGQGLVRFDASGQIVPGLAERWNVTDDGLSYIFRLQPIEWPDGRKVTAQQVARLLKRQIASRSDNELKDTLGAIDEIVPMTDRVLEISLKASRPHLLQLLAQPEFSIVREGQGTGPFVVAKDSKPDALKLQRTVEDLDEESVAREEVMLGGQPARAAVTAFLKGRTDLVLGGTYADLPFARVQQMPRNALRFDPAAGLFGLVPARADGPAADPELRRLLSQAIDRQALIDALNVPGLLPRATLIEPGLDGLQPPAAPPWMAIPIEERRAQLAAAVKRQLGDLEKPVLRIALPNSPGARVLFSRLTADWGAIGITLEAVEPGEAADFVLIDKVAPSSSPAWFVRSFRCGQVPVCDTEADELMDGARSATVAVQRNGLLAQAAQRVDDQQLFIALTAPIRWSLVSDRVQGFATNRFGRHTLTSLRQRLDRERAD
ncbi:MAG TPA: ABC transporter substrate-binding protein [Sphingomicrobium sp.]|nr:ABC transporter substrate-binding protein [Sphingomicrobium sp.]